MLFRSNSVVLIEGTGEASVKMASMGGTLIPIVSEDLSTKVGMVKFEMPATVNSINVSREFRAKGPERVVRVSGTDAGGNRLGRTLMHAIMTNDPDKEIKNEGKISIEFSGSQLVVS